jgi:nitroreductase
MFDEIPSEAWRKRYGFDSPPLPNLAKFLNHRSVRQYKPDPIPRGTIQGLVAAAQSAATSSNLQLYSLISIQDPSRRAAIAEMCGPNSQILSASWFFAFAADHFRLKKAAQAKGEAAAGLSYTEYYTMAVIDAALAAERMVCAAEALGIGICYIGSLRNRPEQVADLLGLPLGVFGLFGLCLGYPEEPLLAEIKPRLRQESIWFEETYRLDPDVEEYNARMKDFYESQGMKGAFDWSMRSGRRVDEFHLEGREGQKAALERSGFASR